MTPLEVARALKELKEDPHVDEVLMKLFNNQDEELITKVSKALDEIDES